MAEPIKGLKTFLDILKFYLSSMTARGCTYLYFNCLDNPRDIIFTNADQELLVQEGYSLSIHVMRVKDDYFFKQLREIFNFLSDGPYIIHIKKTLKLINACLKTGEDVKSFIDVNDQLLLTMANDTRSETEIQAELDADAKSRLEKDLQKKNLWGDEFDDDDDDEFELDLSNIVLPLLEYSYAFGTKMEDYRNYSILREHSEYILDYHRNMKQFPHILLDKTSIEPFRSSTYKLNIDLNDFVDSEGKSVFTKPLKDKYTYLLQDGLDAPSLKEFAKKLPSDWVTNMYLFVDSTKRVCLLSEFYNDDIEIISMRPFVGLFPVEESALKGLKNE